jgi:hypothetical protein
VIEAAADVYGQHRLSRRSENVSVAMVENDELISAYLAEIRGPIRRTFCGDYGGYSPHAFRSETAFGEMGNRCSETWPTRLPGFNSSSRGVRAAGVSRDEATDEPLLTPGV